MPAEHIGRFYPYFRRLKKWLALQKRLRVRRFLEGQSPRRFDPRKERLQKPLKGPKEKGKGENLDVEA